RFRIRFTHKPDCSHERPATIRCHQYTFNGIGQPPKTLPGYSNIVGSGVPCQSARQNMPSDSCESELGKSPGLPTASRMGGIQQISIHLALRDHGILSIWEFHMPPL